MAGTKTEEDAKMAKLYFKYGAMGSSKSAQALITKFNYEELGMTVWLIKPSVDTRDGADIINPASAWQKRRISSCRRITSSKIRPAPRHGCHHCR